MRLVSNASDFYKMGSNIVFILIALLTVVQEQWVEVFSPILPESWYAPVVATLSILGVAARLIDQGLKP